MKKTLLILACVVVLVSLLLVSCGKKDDGADSSTTTTKKGEPVSVEVSTDAQTGEAYITNVNGERIPVTTNKDGAVELIEDLVTKTAKQVEEEKAANNENGGSGSNTPATNAPSPTTPNTTASQDEGSVEIGTGSVMDEEHAAVIDWSN